MSARATLGDGADQPGRGGKGGEIASCHGEIRLCGRDADRPTSWPGRRTNPLAVGAFADRQLVRAVRSRRSVPARGEKERNRLRDVRLDLCAQPAGSSPNRRAA